MKIIRINKDRDVSIITQTITIEHNGYEYTITPDHGGFRVHKYDPDNINLAITIKPCVTNEIIIN